MRRFLLPRPFATGEIFTASGEDFHYLARVLRVKEGSTLSAGDAAGGNYTLFLARRTIDRIMFQVTKEEVAAIDTEQHEIVLLMCLPKPAKMDLIVRMTTEAGVSRIVPLTSEFSLIKERSAGSMGERYERWLKIARAAFEQSGRPVMPVIDPIARLLDLEPARPAEGEIAFFADERGSGTVALHELLGRGPVRRARILVGSEGGLSDAERRSLIAKGFAPVYLGKNILRTETAAVLACAAVNLLLLEKASWKQK